MKETFIRCSYVHCASIYAYNSVGALMDVQIFWIDDNRKATKFFFSCNSILSGVCRHVFY